MTWAQLWPPLIVVGVALAVIGVAVIAHIKTKEDSDLGCLPLVLAVIGVVLLWKSVDVITDLMGK